MTFWVEKRVVGEQPENMLAGVFMSDWMVSGMVVGDDELSSEACKPCVFAGEAWFKTLLFSSAKASQNAL